MMDPMVARGPGSVLSLLVVGTLVIVGCGRAAGSTVFHSDQQGFTLEYPSGWVVSRRADDTRVWFVPQGTTLDPEASFPSTAEFVAVFTVDVPGPVGDDDARRVGLSLLPIHGVSGFRRFKDEGGAGWHRFEVTGSSQAGEWASVGLLVSGPARLQYVVCAKPLEQWREGQKACDELLRTFRPGPL